MSGLSPACPPRRAATPNRVHARPGNRPRLRGHDAGNRTRKITVSSRGIAATKPYVEELETSAFTLRTEQPESDGTLEWDRTNAVVVEARSGDHTGLGYSYTSVGA